MLHPQFTPLAGPDPNATVGSVDSTADNAGRGPHFRTFRPKIGVVVASLLPGCCCRRHPNCRVAAWRLPPSDGASGRQSVQETSNCMDQQSSSCRLLANGSCCQDDDRRSRGRNREALLRVCRFCVLRAGDVDQVAWHGQVGAVQGLVARVGRRGCHVISRQALPWTWGPVALCTHCIGESVGCAMFCAAEIETVFAGSVLTLMLCALLQQVAGCAHAQVAKLGRVLTMAWVGACGPRPPCSSTSMGLHFFWILWRPTPEVPSPPGCTRTGQIFKSVVNKQTSGRM
jgi:hypothetical protein